MNFLAWIYSVFSNMPPQWHAWFALITTGRCLFIGHLGESSLSYGTCAQSQLYFCSIKICSNWLCCALMWQSWYEFFSTERWHLDRVLHRCRMDTLLPAAGGSGHWDGWAGLPWGGGGQGVPAPLCGERSQRNAPVTVRWVYSKSVWLTFTVRWV